MTVLLIVAALGGLGAVIAGTALTTTWWLDRNTPEPPPAPTATELAQEMRAADVAAWDDRVGMPPPATSSHYLRHAHIAHVYITGREVARRG